LYNLIARYAQQIPDKSITEPVHLKLDYLHQLSGNDKNFERELLTQFLEQMPFELKELQQSINACDFMQIRRIAHSLKSTIGYIGLAEELHPYLDKIENDALQEEAGGLASAFGYVEVRCLRALEQVSLLLENNLV
jgi:HPt (histidine-containing phosphotransfer) domain-containing protein